MATWRTIAPSEMDADSPVTATLISALANNPVAMAEQATGAPKIAIETDAQNGTVVATTGWGNHGGLLVDYACSNSGGTSRTISLRGSDDNGSSYSPTTNLFSVPANSFAFARFSLDFATGDIKGVFMTTSGAGGIDTSIAGNEDMTTIQFTSVTDITHNIHVVGTGGEGGVSGGGGGGGGGSISPDDEYLWSGEEW